MHTTQKRRHRKLQGATAEDCPIFNKTAALMHPPAQSESISLDL